MSKQEPKEWEGKPMLRKVFKRENEGEDRKRDGEGGQWMEWKGRR